MSMSIIWIFLKKIFLDTVFKKWFKAGLKAAKIFFPKVWKRFMALKPLAKWRLGCVFFFITTLFFAWLWWNKTCPDNGGITPPPINGGSNDGTPGKPKPRPVIPPGTPPDSPVEVDPVTGKVTTHKMGLTFLPKIGIMWRDQLNPAAGARLIYVGSHLGGEFMFTKKHFSPGADFRLPYFNQATFSVGYAFPYSERDFKGITFGLSSILRDRRHK